MPLSAVLNTIVLKYESRLSDTHSVIICFHAELLEAQQSPHWFYFPAELKFIILLSDKHLHKSILHDSPNHQSLIKQSWFFPLLTCFSACQTVKTVDPFFSAAFLLDYVGKITLVKTSDDFYMVPFHFPLFFYFCFLWMCYIQCI